MKRRDFLNLSAVASIFLIAGCDIGRGNSYGRGNIQKFSDISNLEKTTTQLPIPDLIEGSQIEGVKHYNIGIKEREHSFFKDKKTKTYAFGNSSYLGPTIKLKNGDSISINYKNNLKEQTTVHGHGMHVPASMDGGPYQIINPGSSWSAKYIVKQKASTNWYHPHLMGKTADHVYMGLAGLIIVEDDEILNLDLPKRYGIDDIPLVLQDRVFDNSAQLDYSPSMREIMHGYIGDIPITNGAIEPYFEVEEKEIRFRILNGSNASVYELVFDDDRSFKQIATDNSLLEAPVSLNTLRLSPAERAEIIVDFSSSLGKNLTLKDKRSGKKFLEIRVSKTATIKSTTPATLTNLERLDSNKATFTRRFTLGGSMRGFGRGMKLQINGKSMDMNRIDEKIPLNQVEIWEIENQMMMEHNFHIHATHFEILERNGVKVAKNERGFKDVVYLGPRDRVKLIVKMKDYRDSKNAYMYHCHFLEHEDAGMMGQFIVT